MFVIRKNEIKTKSKTNNQKEQMLQFLYRHWARPYFHRLEYAPKPPSRKDVFVIGFLLGFLCGGGGKQYFMKLKLHDHHHDHEPI